MDAAHGLLRLQQEDFPDNTVNILRNLRQTSQYHDVLVTAGERVEKAHRFLLADASTFFKNILDGKGRQGTGGVPTVIVLRGVKEKELAMILDYIYTGEITVSEDALESFMAAAKDLRIRGLCDEEGTNPRMKRTTASTSEVVGKKNPTNPDPAGMTGASTDDADNPGQQVDDGGLRVKSELKDFDPDLVKEEAADDEEEDGDAGQDDDNVDQAGTSSSKAGTESKLDFFTRTKMLKDNKGGFLCILCKKKFLNGNYTRQHMWNSHVAAEVRYKCPICNKIIARERNIYDHVRVKHDVSMTKKALAEYIVKEENCE